MFVMETTSSAGTVLGGLTILLVLFIMYFLPALIARARKHRQANAILALNLFLGWSILGWIIALIWSFTAPAPPVQTIIVHAPPAPPAAP